METEAIRVRQSASAHTDAAVLTRLASDPSVTVRASLALNPGVPAEVDALLARDPDSRVRELLARKLGVLVPSLSDAAREALRERTWGLLTQLAEDAAERVRAAVAAEVKDAADAPRALILGLAQDPKVTVCEPVILFSPMLTPADLVALVAAAPSAGTREAVARRADIPEIVSDAIAASADDTAIRALLANQSAQIREATLDALVAGAADHGAWHDPLVRRPVLSARATRALSEIVASHLLQVLAARPDVPEELRTRLRQRLIGAATTNTESVASVEARLLEAARGGDSAGAIALLATKAEVPASLVEQAATLRSTKGLVALCWKAHLPMGIAVTIQELLAKVPSCRVIQAGPGDSYPLTIEEMKWQLELLAGASVAAEPEGQAWFSGGSGSRVQTR